MALLRQIEKIVKYLERDYPQFPDKMCNIASDELSKRLGFYMVTGEVYNPENRKLIALHTWNYDLKRQLYVDVTLHQFAELKQFGPIVIVPKCSKLSRLIYGIPSLESLK
jgi:hypothetical protein